MAYLKTIWNNHKRAVNITQLEAAQQLGWTQSAFSQYINGKIPLNFDAAIKLSELFNVPIWDLDPKFSPLKQVHREAFLREI